MARHYVIGGRKFHRKSLIKLDASERAALAAGRQVVVRRPVAWPLADRIADFAGAEVDPGGTDLWGPGPYLKVPNRAADDDHGEVVNRVFCPWGYPPDRLRISRSSRYFEITAVGLEREDAQWFWILTLAELAKTDRVDAEPD